MKNIIIIVMILLLSNISSNAQLVSTVYNTHAHELFDDPVYYNNQKQNAKKHFVKCVVVTGVLVGGLLLANQANNHNYYINNTTLYGVGGVMTVLATGLVISSVTYLNKQIDFACTDRGLTVRVNI